MLMLFDSTICVLSLNMLPKQSGECAGPSAGVQKRCHAAMLQFTGHFLGTRSGGNRDGGNRDRAQQRKP